jgi:putative transposase
VRPRVRRTVLVRTDTARAPDLVGRQWWVGAPNLLATADFTYVALDTGGFGYTAFVVDAYAGLIAGWECSMTKDTGFRRTCAAPRSGPPRPSRPSIRRYDPSS